MIDKLMVLYMIIDGTEVFVSVFWCTCIIKRTLDISLDALVRQNASTIDINFITY